MSAATPHRKQVRHFHEPGDQASLDYIHSNPVKRGLRIKARDWRWSSARYYESEGRLQDAALPRIVPLPADFWSVN